MDQWSLTLVWTRRWHRRATAAQAQRSSSACLALTTRGEATEAMTTGRIVAVTVAAQARRLLSASCLTLTTRGGATGALSRWQGGSGGGACPAFVAGLLGVEVEDKRGIRLATGGNRRAQPARTLMQWFWRKMRRVIQNGESFSPAINMCECHTTNQNSYNSSNFSVLPALVQNRAGQGCRVPEKKRGEMRGERRVCDAVSAISLRGRHHRGVRHRRTQEATTHHGTSSEAQHSAAVSQSEVTTCSPFILV
jgi:hypothetical protein